MTDIVERLRKWGDVDKFPNPIQVINQFREERFEAADLIERYHNALCKIAHMESETHMGWIAKCALNESEKTDD